MPEILDNHEFELLARIAHRYYVDGLTQDAIARETGLSRPKVQRLLDRARTSGVVDVHVEVPPWLHLDLEMRLREAFDLDAAIVSRNHDQPGAQREDVARAGARFLERRLQDDMVVAVSHGRDVAELATFVRPDRPVACVFVGAMGGSPGIDAPTNPNEICRVLADRCGGRSVGLYAPAYLATSRLRDQLLAEEAVGGTLRLAAGAAIALVGIGGTDDDCTMVRSGCSSLDEIGRLRREGAVGDVLGNYVDAAGRAIESPDTGRLVGLSLDDLRAIETVVAVVSEPEKPQAILGVLRTGVLRVLVVDEGNAKMVLALAGGSS
jgi:DNA-binding transcriptional regulator LsrR (DeoR family)